MSDLMLKGSPVQKAFQVMEACKLFLLLQDSQNARAMAGKVHEAIAEIRADFALPPGVTKAGVSEAGDAVLLQLVAKHLGRHYDRIDERGCWTKSAQYGDDSFSWKCFNPLSDPGNALWLAVEFNVFGHPLLHHHLSLAMQKPGRDVHEATRRAIVLTVIETVSTV